MQHPSNSNSNEKLKIQPCFPKPDESRDNAIDSSPRFVQNNNIPRPNGDRETKVEIQFLSPQHNPSCLILAPPGNATASLNLDKAIEYHLKHGRKLDPNMDRQKLRRAVSNRLSAQRCRIKKAHYINAMEKKVKDLEEYISVLTPQVESYKEQQTLLLLQNASLQRLLRIRLNESWLSEIELEKNRMEVSRLKEVLEETLSKNSCDAGGGQLMQDLISEQLITQQNTSIGIYGKGLQKVESKQFRQKQVPHSVLVQSRPTMALNSSSEQPAKDQQQGSGRKLLVAVSTPKKNQEEEEIDQYLNFEE